MTNGRVTAMDERRRILKLISIKMTHENRNFVLDALSDLKGEITAKTGSEVKHDN